jgi:Glycosyltransferase family 9 (heptosyltransferase)
MPGADPRVGQPSVVAEGDGVLALRPIQRGAPLANTPTGRRWDNSANSQNRLAILNGFGRCMGDTIIGLQALAVAHGRGLIGPRPTVFRLPDRGPVIDGIYAAAADIVETRDLPWDDATRKRPFAGATDFDRVIDIRDFAFDPHFRQVAMIDYFLRKLGVDPASVVPAERRNAWLAPRISLPEVANERVLVCPISNSPLRNMPEAVHTRVLDWFLARGLPVLTQATLPRCDNLTALCNLMVGARLVVSVDTGMVHLADALGVPCLAFFISHRPVWRVRDYPLCIPVHLPAPGLPEALEFPRDDTDVDASQAAWFEPDADLRWLDAALARAWAENECHA